MDFNKLENSFTRLKRQMSQLSKWETSKIHPLDIDYLKKLTQQFYGDLMDLDLASTPESTPKQEVSAPVEVEKVTPAPEVAPTPIVERILEEAVVAPTQIPAMPPAPQPAVIQQAPKLETPTTPVKETAVPVVASNVPNDPVVVMNPSMRELFDIPSGSDLSEILRNRKIDHIGNSMGFNEKIFTINELFDGDRALFDETIGKLNELNSFEDAKSYLIKNIVDTYGWSSDKKLKNAQTFIRHISRKYQKVEA